MIKARKHLTNSIKEFPIPRENEKIVRVLEVRGSNQVSAEYPDKSQILCLMPNKFKKVLWIAKGHYLIIKEAEVTSNTSGYQIKGVITHVLQDDAVRYLKKSKQFPIEFEDVVIQEEKKEILENDEEDEEGEEEDEEGNPNRVVFSD
jgi:translation initiation factor IF-1